MSLPFHYADESDAALTGAVGRKCRRHEWALDWYLPDDADPSERSLSARAVCRKCRAVRDDVKAKRGKSARRHGNDFEREVCHLLGIRHTGQYGGPEDGGDAEDWIAVQCKVGVAYPERIDGWLRAIPVRADRQRAVVIGDSPGPGKKRRAIIVLELGEFCQWYGKP